MSRKKYGLIIPKTSGLGKGQLGKAASIFGNESSEEDETKRKAAINQELNMVAEKKKQTKQTKGEIEKAIQQDPTVYKYDEIYEQMEEQKISVGLKTADKDKKPKYIGNLLKSAAARQQEHERRVERKVEKDRSKEGDEFADKESFVTSAYRKKMIERAEEEEKLKRQDKIDAANDVTKKKDLTQFYRHLLDRKVGTGESTDAEKKHVEAKKEKVEEFSEVKHEGPKLMDSAEQIIEDGRDGSIRSGKKKRDVVTKSSSDQGSSDENLKDGQLKEVGVETMSRETMKRKRAGDRKEIRVDKSSSESDLESRRHRNGAGIAKKHQRSQKTYRRRRAESSSSSEDDSMRQTVVRNEPRNDVNAVRKDSRRKVEDSIDDTASSGESSTGDRPATKKKHRKAEAVGKHVGHRIKRGEDLKSSKHTDSKHTDSKHRDRHEGSGQKTVKRSRSKDTSDSEIHERKRSKDRTSRDAEKRSGRSTRHPKEDISAHEDSDYDDVDSQKKRKSQAVDKKTLTKKEDERQVFSKRTDSSSALLARERYLARKNARKGIVLPEEHPN